MSDKKINLEEILNEHFNSTLILTHDNSGILRAMKEACKQVLELGAENARIIEENDPDYERDNIYISHRDEEDEIFIVKKESIINTLNEVE
jgi:hypothetical protein